MGTELVSTQAWTDLSDNDVQGADPFTDHPDVPTSEFEDDFTQMLRQRNQASVAPISGVALDDLETEIQYREKKRENYTRQAPNVSTNPPSSFGAVLGGQAVVLSGVQTDELVFWTGEEHESAGVTVALGNAGQGATGNAAIGINGIQYNSSQMWPTANNGVTAYSYRPYAIIRWGTRSGSYRAKVDLCAGTQISLNASAVYVRLGMEVAPSGYVTGAMNLMASLAFGTRNSTMGPQHTQYVDSLASGSTQNLVVPAFAASLLQVLRADVTGTVALNFKDASGTVLYSYLITGAPAQQMMNIPVANDVYSVDVVNQGSLTTTFRLVYGLAL